MGLGFKLRFLTLIALATLVAAHSAHSEQATDSATAITVEAAVREGLARSPEVQRAQAAVDEKRWRHFESLGAGFLPKVTVGAQHYFDTEYTVTGVNFGGASLAFPGFYPVNQATIDVTIPIFNGLSNIRQLEAASLFQDAAQQELSFTEFSLSQNIRLAFYQTLAAFEIQKAAEENVKTLEDHLRQVKVQKQGGVATNYDNLRVEVQLSEAKADAIDAEDNLALARKKLTQLLGLERDDRPLDGALPMPQPEKVQNLELTELPRERTDIQALNSKADAADHLHDAQSVWLVPTISLGGEYMLYDQQIFDQVINNTGNYKSAYNIGIFLKWNLFDGGVSLAQARESAYAAVQASKTAQIAKLQIPFDFAYWKRRYLSNSDHYQSKQFDIKRSEESVRLAKEEERAGTRTSTETLDAELDLYKARAGVVNAQVNAAEAQIRLELALGRKI